MSDYNMWNVRSSQGWKPPLQSVDITLETYPDENEFEVQVNRETFFTFCSNGEIIESSALPGFRHDEDYYAIRAINKEGNLT
jgi:hypothetical protein